MGPQRQKLLDILSQHPGGLPAEDLIRQAAAPADRLRVLDALRHLAGDGRVCFERERSPYTHDLHSPRVRLAVTGRPCRAVNVC
jgi:Fe2+ or Zn2+ uptake regulation protein